MAKNNENAPRFFRSRRTSVIMLVVAILLPIAGYAAGQRVKSPRQAAADAKPPPVSTLTVPVERRVLKRAVVVRGNVTSQSALSVSAPTVSDDSTATVTAVPLSPLQQVKEGSVLIEIAGDPVVAMQADFPMFRSIVFGTRGPDVKSVQLTLTRLGYATPITSTLDEPTAASLAKFFTAIGYATPTGPDGKVRLAKGSIVFQPVFPLTVISVPALGVVLDPSQPTSSLTLATPELSVESTLSPSQNIGITVGSPVEIINDNSNVTYEGTIETLASAPTVTTAGEAGFPMRLKPTKPLPESLRGTNLRVVVTTASTKSEVLVVPISAIVTGADGANSVLVFANGQRRPVKVTVGLEASGFVEVSPAAGGALSPNDQVIVGSA